MNAVTATKMAGVTYRQLSYWVECGYLSADGRPQAVGTGNYRDFTAAEVTRLDLMARLVKVGVRPSKAAEYARSMVAAGGRSIGLSGHVSIVVGWSA